MVRLVRLLMANQPHNEIWVLSLTWIRCTLTRQSKRSSMVLGKKSVTVVAVVLYSDTVTKTVLAVMVLPSIT